MTIARKMAQWATALKYADLPDKTIHEVKRRVIDSLATTFGAYRSRPARVARAQAQAAHDPPPAGPACASNHICSRAHAALARGARIR